MIALLPKRAVTDCAPALNGVMRTRARYVHEAAQDVNGKVKAALTIGERIKAVRLRTGLAQDRFASTLGYSRRALINWEQGVAEPPIGILAKLRRAFDVDPEWIVLGEDTQPRRHYGQIDRDRFRRIKGDVDTACAQVGMELGEDIRLTLIHDLYDDDPGDDDANRKRLRRTLLALSKGKPIEADAQ